MNKVWKIVYIVLYHWRAYPSLFLEAQILLHHLLPRVSYIYTCHLHKIPGICGFKRALATISDDVNHVLLIYFTEKFSVRRLLKGLHFPSRWVKFNMVFFFREIEMIWHIFEHHAKCKQSCVEILRNSFHRNIVDTLIISTGVRRKRLLLLFLLKHCVL